MTEFNFRDDAEEVGMTAQEATFLGRENAAVLIPFNARYYCGSGSRHDEQEFNDVFALHQDWWGQAPFQLSRNDMEFRSYDKNLWLNERCSTALERSPDGQDFFLWVAQAQRVGNLDTLFQERAKAPT